MMGRRKRKVLLTRGVSPKLAQMIEKAQTGKEQDMWTVLPSGHQIRIEREGDALEFYLPAPMSGREKRKNGKRLFRLPLGDERMAQFAVESVDNYLLSTGNRKVF